MGQETTTIPSVSEIGFQMSTQPDVENPDYFRSLFAEYQIPSGFIFDIVVERSGSPEDRSHSDLQGMQMVIMGSKNGDDSRGSLEKISPTTWELHSAIELYPDIGELTFVIQSEDGDDIGCLPLTKEEVGKYVRAASSSGMQHVEHQFVMEVHYPALLLKFAISGVKQNQEVYAPLPLTEDNAPLFDEVESLLGLSQETGIFADACNFIGYPQEEILDNFGTIFLRRFRQTGNPDDVLKAIEYQQRAVKLAPEGHPNMPSWLNKLATLFGTRFEQTGYLDDVSKAIEYQHSAVVLTPEGHDAMPARLSNLGAWLSSRFKRTGRLEDISKAIEYQHRAIALAPEGHDDMPSSLNNLGNSFFLSFQQTGNPNEISKAIEYQQRAVALTPEGHINMPLMLNNLAMSFFRWSEQTGDLHHISKAIDYLQHAIALVSEVHGDMPSSSWLNNFGALLSSRFERTGNLDDIFKAIEYGQRSVALTPEGHADMPLSLNNLGVSFNRRFEQTDDLEDVSKAIEYQQRAVALAPKDHVNMPAWLCNLGYLFRSRFQRKDDLDDISKAIDYQQRGVDLTPEGHVNMPFWLSNLGTSFSCRFERTGHLDDISKAIKYQQRSIWIIPESHTHMPWALSNLGASFLLRFEQTYNPDDISEAIEHQQRAIALTPEGHAHIPALRTIIGTSLMKHIEHTGSLAGYKDAANNFRIAATQLSGPPSVRLDAARRWARISLVSGDPVQSLQAYTVAVELLSLVAGLDQTIQKRHTNLIYLSDVSFTPEAVKVAISAQYTSTALEWLEQGRCLVWAQLNQLRTPVNKLRAYNAPLADRFLTVSKALESSGSRPELLAAAEMAIAYQMKIEDQAHTHLKLAQEWSDILAEIRRIPDFQDFLQPPKVDTILSRLPPQGPIIIINVHTERCDALALIHGADEVLHIPLDGITHEKVVELCRDLRNYLASNGLLMRGDRAGRPSCNAINSSPLRRILRILWKGVVKPILDALGYSSMAPRRNRIWWCPIGPLAFLPIHAAGIYDRKVTTGTCLSDYAISSYIPTVNTLLEKLGHSSRASESDTKILLISQAHTPGQDPIPGTTHETQAILDRAAMDGVRATRLEDGEATTRRVGEELRSHQWVHFACHASQNPTDPLKSAFHLHDGQLELMDLIRQELPTAEFAFLSACQTSVGDEKLSDEAVHLAAGMLAAGYQGVVGTMWSIGDVYAPKIAEGFYGHLLKDRRNSGSRGLNSGGAANALDHAIRKIRKDLPDTDHSFLTWVPYVHYGL